MEVKRRERRRGKARGEGDMLGERVGGGGRGENRGEKRWGGRIIEKARVGVFWNVVVEREGQKLQVKEFLTFLTCEHSCKIPWN